MPKKFQEFSRILKKYLKTRLFSSINKHFQTSNQINFQESLENFKKFKGSAIVFKNL